MSKKFSIAVLVYALGCAAASAATFQNHNQMMDHGDGHLMDMDGAMVMGQNTDTLPGGCDKIAATKEITVRAGHKYAEKFPGTMFGFDQHEFQFEPCTKLTVHFINDDEIRHQWMMHGLPKYLYPQGMFHLEVSGPGEVSGTLILPPGDKTYLVHCDIAQHMEKGMKAQLKVGKGGEDLPSIPGVSAHTYPDDYRDISAATAIAAAEQQAVIAEKQAAILAATPAKSSDKNAADGSATTSGSSESAGYGVMVIGLALGFALAPVLAKKFKGMSVGEVIAYSFELIAGVLGGIINMVTKLFKSLFGKKAIALPDNK